MFVIVGSGKVWVGKMAWRLIVAATSRRYKSPLQVAATSRRYKSLVQGAVTYPDHLSVIASTATAAAWVPVTGLSAILRMKECTVVPSGRTSSNTVRPPSMQHW